MHGKAATRRQRVRRTLARVFAGWRTGLPGPVLVLQAGNALNSFGTGLILPFEIIYLHAVRGFSTATAGLVLATVMGTAAVVTLPSGALLDRFSAKRILIAGNVVNALGYGGLAFVDRPWQGFVCAAVGGAGFGFVGTAGQVLTLTLVPAEQRAASTALRRVAGNFGLGLGATVAGFIVAATHHHLQAFQGLYLFDAVTFVVFALVVLVWIPDPGLADAPSASEGAQGFRAVARDRLLLALIAGNLALVMIGGAFFSNILPPFAEAHTPVGPGEIGVVVFINTFFIVVAQIPATRVVKRMRRTHALFATSAIFAVGLLAVLLATLTHSTLTATTVLAGVAILIAIAECGQFIVLGPLVAEIAPPHLLGRYMSLYGLSFTAGVALGPAVGGVLLATSPDTIWWGGALALALTGAGFLRLGNRLPDPLRQTQCPPPQAVTVADPSCASGGQPRPIHHQARDHPRGGRIIIMDHQMVQQRFAALTTAHLADACIRAQVPVRCASALLRAVVPGSRLAGRVCPARHAGSVDAFLEAFETAAPGDVLVVDNGGLLDEACVGDLVALEAHAAGMEGMVIWGLHRDTADIRAIGLPVFSLGAIPTGPLRLDARPPGALESAVVGDCLVTRDDLVLGDDDGVLFVPSRQAEEIFTLAETIRDTERRQAERIRAGVSLRSQVRFSDYLAKRGQTPALSFREHLRAVGGAIEE